MKGIFYSLMAIMLLIPVVTFVTFYSSVADLQSEESLQRTIGNKIVSFSNSVDIDLKKALNIYARRSIGNAIGFISVNGTPLDNAPFRIEELFVTNTIYGSAPLINSSILEWRNKMVVVGENLGFDISINFSNIEFLSYDSFNVVLNVIAVVNISFQDTNLYRIYNESVIVSIEDYEDPLYILNTNGLVKNTIVRSTFYITDVTELDAMTIGKLYISSLDGASFFDRLEGNLLASDLYKSQSPNQIGLESIVYQPDLLAFGITPKTTQTFVDYLYFNSSSITGYPVNNSVVSWLKIDLGHKSIYDVDLITS